MKNPFATEVVTKVFQSGIDRSGPGDISISVKDVGEGFYHLVIGAYYDDKCCCVIDKQHMHEIADMLHEIANTMKDKGE